MNSLFAVPFVRWADVVRIETGGAGARDRRIYDHELVYVLEGEGEIVLDGCSHGAPADSLFFVRPRVLHSFLSPRESQLLLGVHFDWERRDDSESTRIAPALGAPFDSAGFRSSQPIEGWDLARRPALDLRGRPRVRRALEAVVSENHRVDRWSPSIVGALLAAALGMVAREVRLLEEIASHENAPPDAVRRVQRARELLEKPEAPFPSIEDVARSVGWSGDHLRRMCRLVTGVSPLEIQSAARLRRAQQLLRYGQLSNAQIAERLGWSDASHFTRAFRHATGMTPREWMHWEGKNRIA